MNHNIITIGPRDSFYSVYRRIRDAFPDGTGRVFLIIRGSGAFSRNFLYLELLIQHFPGIKFALVARNKHFASHCRKMGITCYARTRDIQLQEFSLGNEILRENFTFWQFFTWSVRRYVLRTRKSWFMSYQKYREYIGRLRSSIFILLLIGVCVAVLLVITIFFFTLPKTTIILKPETFVDNVQANMVFIEEGLLGGLNTFEVPIRRHRYSISYTDQFLVTHYDVSRAGQAAGTIRLYNFSDEDIRLRPKTRVMSEDSVIFRTQDWVNIPSGDPSTSFVDIQIVADHYDLHGGFVGSRGNLAKGAFFMIPGLVETGAGDDVRGESIVDFTGGTDDVTPVLSENQYEDFLALFTDRMSAQAEKEILRSSGEIQEGYYILPIHGITKPVDIKASSDFNPGDVTPEVTYTGIGEFETVTFHLPTVHKHLLTIMSGHVLENAQEIVDTPEGMVDIVHVFYQETDPYRVKATVQDNVTYRYRLDSDIVKAQFLDNFLNQVVGKQKGEALKSLLNNPMIANAQIKITPFWKRQISYNPKDIVFRIQE